MLPWDEVLAAVGTALAGRSDEARLGLETLWSQTGPGDHAQRCVIAHYLADQQGEIADEIRWDQHALDAHGLVADGDLAPVGIPSAAAMLPSLQLNLGDDHCRAGDLASARVHLAAARESEHALPADGYGAMTRGGIDRLEQRLAG